MRSVCGQWKVDSSVCRVSWAWLYARHRGADTDSYSHSPSTHPSSTLARPGQDQSGAVASLCQTVFLVHQNLHQIRWAAAVLRNITTWLQQSSPLHQLPPSFWWEKRSLQLTTGPSDCSTDTPPVSSSSDLSLCPPISSLVNLFSVICQVEVSVKALSRRIVGCIQRSTYPRVMLVNVLGRDKVKTSCTTHIINGWRSA